nr:hypothetical protein [Sulfurimonas sp. SAG-AH-194-I05]
MYKIDEFRIFYDKKGKNKLLKKNKDDCNNNNIPDYIENIGLKLQVTSKILQESFHFISPLQSNRYKNKVKYIDVHVLNMKNNGSGGDGIIYYKYKALLKNESASLSIKLSRNLRAKTQTPPHELFHLYQNGYTMFKNRWYTEGTARWSEYILKKGTGSRKKLPSTQNELERVLNKTYDTKYMWRRLAYLLDKNNGKFLYPKGIDYKIKGYAQVIEDNRIYGYDFMRIFLENLSKMDKIASHDYGIPIYDWPEELQKSSQNNKYILKALTQSIRQMNKTANKELLLFLGTVDRYIK